MFPDPAQCGVLAVYDRGPLPLPVGGQHVAGGQEHVGRQREPSLDHPVRGGGQLLDVGWHRGQCLLV